MKVALSVIGKFHTFDLARELHQQGMLAGVFTAYPRFKLKGEGLPADLIQTFPWLMVPYLGLPRKEQWLGEGVVRWWEYQNRRTFDAHVATRLPPCDVFVGLSSAALRSGQAAQRHGARYVCDRGSTHIREQDSLLREEHDRWGLPYEAIDPRTIELEEAEYQMADLITVPSTFNQRSFIKRGVAAGKVTVLPYGVNLSRFQPVGQPASDTFDVLFVGGLSLRKGVPDLIKAFEQLVHPRKRLTLVGTASPAFIDQLRLLNLWSDDFVLKGHVPQDELKTLMSRAHVMVLPSVEEGLALVQAQAMACGCPVIATTHTGAEDLFEDGVQGYIVPIRQPDQVAQRLQHLADHPQVRHELGQRALARVQQAGGWAQYGRAAVSTYAALLHH